MLLQNAAFSQSNNKHYALAKYNLATDDKDVVSLWFYSLLIMFRRLLSFRTAIWLQRFRKALKKILSLKRVDS